MTVTDIAPYLGEKQPFNPNEHMLKLKSKEGLKDYLPIQWRLVWFREQCPEGTIDTEEITVDLDRECESEISVWNQDTRRSEKTLKIAKGYARYKAVVTDGHGGRATGHGSESAVDFSDFIEKAETKAVGRALAMLGYGTAFAPELDEHERIVDAPTTVTEQKSTRPYNERRAFVEADKIAASMTDQQEASIRKLCEHLGRPMPEGVEASTYTEAKALIEQLSKEYREHRANQPATDQALHALAQPGSYEQHEANGNQDTVAITRGDLYSRGEEKGLWSRTSPEKFYAWASSIAARPQSRTAWDMTVTEMGEMAKRIYAEPGIKASAGTGK